MSDDDLIRLVFWLAYIGGVIAGVIIVLIWQWFFRWLSSGLEVEE